MQTNPEGAPVVPQDTALVVETNPEQENLDSLEEAPQVVAEPEESNDMMVPISELRKVRSEAASLRQRLRNSEHNATTLEAEREALTSERDTLREQIQGHDLEKAVLTAASDPKMGARNPTKLLRLIDRNNLQFKEGVVEGVEAELQRLRSEWPELFVVGGADGGAQNRGNVTVAPGHDRLVNAYASNSR